MTEPTRYNCHMHGPSSDGHFIEYTDYAALARRLTEVLKYSYEKDAEIVILKRALLKATTESETFAISRDAHIRRINELERKHDDLAYRWRTRYDVAR